MIPLLASQSRHAVTNFLRPSLVYSRRTIHGSPARRGGIFRNAEGRWSASTGTILGTLTIREIFALLSGLLTSEYAQNRLVHIQTPVITPVYMLCRVQDSEGRCREFEARARGFLLKGIEERRKAVKILIAARESLRQKEKEAEQDGEPFDEKDARLKAETLKVLERQEKFLNNLDAGEPVEVSPGHRFRKPRG